jgi:hypothetical protein
MKDFSWSDHPDHSNHQSFNRSNRSDRHKRRSDLHNRRSRSRETSSRGQPSSMNPNSGSGNTPAQNQRSIRLSISLLILFFFIVISIGILGFYTFFNLGPVDAILNSSMYVSGMGPIEMPKTTPQKLFISGYAILAGFLFIAVGAFLLNEFVDAIVFPDRNQ